MTLASVLVAGAAHFAWPKEEIKIAGGGVPVEAKIGTAFEDMTQGVLTAEAVDDAPLTPQPQVETPDKPDVEETPKPQVEAALQPQLQDYTTAPQPTAVERPVVQPTEAPEPAPLLAAPSLNAVLPMVVAPTPDALPRQITRHLAPKPVEIARTPLTPLTPQVAEATPTPVAPTETIAAEDPDSTAPPLSVRPQRRDPEKAAAVAAARPKPKKAQQTKQKTQRGNAQQNRRAGANTGTNQKAKATTSGKGPKVAAQAGNAANSNYRGKVFRRLQRAGRITTRARGSATVSFRIALSGGLERVSLSRSSGSNALDQAALRQIRRAAPFPKPPAGVDRSFSIKIKGN